MRRQNTETLDQVIQRYIKSIGAEPKIMEIRVKNSWDEVMGTAIAQQTKSIFLRGKVLFVKIQSPIVKAELSMLKQSILLRMNEAVGEGTLTEIRFI